MSDEKKVYIIGHRNPDTDSIVSAIAYSQLKHLKGMKNCYPARAGKINLQTEYVLNRFNMKQPEFIPDLIPRASNYMSHHPITIHENTPLWKALDVLNSENHKMLPVVDNENHLKSVLHYNTFAKNMLKKINPHKKSIIPTSITHLMGTLNAQPIVTINEDELFNSQILVAASHPETVREFACATPCENIIIIVGDRDDIHEMVIEKGVRCVIVTGGKMISKKIKSMAEEKSVSILISPFDTSTSSLLAFYSTPVIHMSDSELEPVKQDEYIKNIKKAVSQSPSRALPVVNDKNQVIGILSQGDLIQEPNIEIIMVDHNELTQSIEGIENYRILEIIDHHRLGNIHTNTPITFINKPVGSTSTIIATLYDEQKIPIKKEIASIILAGILSDTLVLRSSTTTETDKDMAEYLSGITDLDIDTFGNDIMNAASIVSSKPVGDILQMDLKNYSHEGKTYSVSQVEVNSPEELMVRKDDILSELGKLQGSGKHIFSVLMVTDITMLNSVLFVKGDEDIIREITYPKIEDDIFLMKGILSRKKQLIPYLAELFKAIS
ncbi:putative manganese-dependent inorganic diphosphatase [Spirochaetota bacterium]